MWQQAPKQCAYFWFLAALTLDQGHLISDSILFCNIFLTPHQHVLFLYLNEGKLLLVRKILTPKGHFYGHPRKQAGFDSAQLWNMRALVELFLLAYFTKKFSHY